MAELSPMAQERTETQAEARIPGRELVVVEDRAGSVPAFGDRPLAGFVAQLIACGRRLPPYRAKGRASPETATRSYARDDVAVPPKGKLDLVV